MTIQTGQKATAADVLAAVAAPQQIASSGHFYADAGATVVRYGDRLLVGAATDSQAKANRALSADWLSVVMASTSIGAYAVWGATTASIARYGTMGLLAASRTSDAAGNAGMLGYTPSTIGIASWAIDDDVAAPRSTTGYAYYGEAWRMPGVTYQPSFGMELEGVEFGTAHLGIANPYHPNVGGGVSVVQLGSGGGQTASAVVDVASFMSWVSNPARAQVGLVIGATSLTGTNGSAGDTGYGSAIAMARNQGIEWHTPETPAGGVGSAIGLFIRSTVAAAANGTRIEAQDAGVVISNAAGQLLFAIQTAAAPASTLSVQAGAGAGAPGVYVAQASGGSANLGLFPAAGGELQIQSPVGNAGGALPGTAAGGFLHINVNGADLRIPLLTPAQAGT